MRKSHWHAWSGLFAVVIGMALHGPACGASNEQDGAEIRAVIESQLAAFAADDAARAFSFASPNIQRMFGTPDDFMAMVKSSYPVVYRPASVLFKPLQHVEDASIQVVQMSDAGGHVWLAVYRMQRQADGSWRIDGCVLRPAESKST